MIDSNTRIGRFFPKEIETKEILDNMPVEVKRILMLHNQLVEKVIAKEWSKQDFLSFRKVISTEKVKQSELLLDICDFFINQPETLVLQEIQYLQSTNFITVTETEQEKSFLALCICNIMGKLFQFTQLPIESFEETQPEYTLEQKNNYLMALEKMKNHDSDYTCFWNKIYQEWIHQSFSWHLLQKFFLQRQELVYKYRLNFIAFKVRVCSNYLESKKDAHYVTKLASIKEEKAKKQLRGIK